MRDSWEKGTWLLNYVARRFWVFDFIWWKFLAEKYFGPNEDQDAKARIHLLTQPQRDIMDSFVARKLQEKENRQLMEWGERRASEILAQALV